MRIIVTLFLFSVLLPISAQVKMAFWDNSPRRGCNYFNEVPREQWFKDAASINIEWVRLAYDFLNEPYPERGTDIEEQTEVGDADRFIGWYEKNKGTTRDLYDFYRRIIKAVRQIDPETPIMVESGFYNQPPAYTGWPGKLDDDKILYSFHMYEPYSFTSWNNFRKGGKYSYPGNIEFGTGLVQWNKNTIDKYFEPFYFWAEKNSIPVNRIVASEFGCVRRNKGAGQYLEDVLSIIENRKYHWAFYSFREDGWDGYDYELGTEGPGAEYWAAKDRGENPELKRMDNPLFDVIKKYLIGAVVL